MNTLALQQAIIATTTENVNNFGLIIAGILVLAFGIIMSHFIPNKYWIVVIVIGIIIAVVGVIVLLFGPLW